MCWSGKKSIIAITRQILVKFLSFKDEDHADRKGKVSKKVSYRGKNNRNFIKDGIKN